MAERTCMEAALSKLNYRMRSKAELVSSLRELGYEEDEISDTIAELETFGYVNDRRFSEEFIRSSSRKNWSSSRMMRSLREKGISSELAKEAIDSFFEDSESETSGSYDRKKALETGLKMAEEQIRKGKEVDEKFMGRVGRRLVTLGYDSSTCYYVIGVLRKKTKQQEEEEEFF